MSDLVSSMTLWALSGLAIVSAIIVVWTRDVLRLVLGLGAFMLAVAGIFLYGSLTFLAIAQIFLYVGGVLVLFIFALVLTRRNDDGSPRLTRVTTPDAVVASVGLFGLFSFMFGPLSAGSKSADRSPESTVAVADTLLGPLLPQFEMVGALLLAALLCVVVIVAQGRGKP